MKLLTLSCLLVGFAAVAEVPSNVQNEINLRVKHNINPSIVVGLYENGQSHFYTQGSREKKQAMTVTKNSVYEIGSITKTFTSLLLATLVQDKKVGLDDAIEDFWPKPFALKTRKNQPINFKHLATHTSGLPRLPYNLMAFSKDPYANYDRNQLIEAINNTEISNTGQYVYSNFAVGLLGETLSVIENKTFNQLIEQVIIKPLKLNHTYMQLEQVPQELVVQGYAGNKAATAWNFKALAAAGSIRSSIEDLLAYGVAYTHTNNPLSQAMELTMKTHFQQDKLEVGLGWHFNDGVFWHNGGTDGFRSMLMIDPKNKKVVAGITNHNKNDVEDIVAHLMDPSKPMKKFDIPLSISDEDLMLFIGEYKQIETAKTIKITHKNQKLIFNAPGQKDQTLQFIGEDTFKFGIMKIKIKFNKNQAAEVDSLSLMGWGKPQKYKKTRPMSQ